MKSFKVFWTWCAKGQACPNGMSASVVGTTLELSGKQARVPYRISQQTARKYYAAREKDTKTGSGYFNTLHRMFAVGRSPKKKAGRAIRRQHKKGKMGNGIDTAAVGRWDKARASYTYYANYLAEKKGATRNKLSLLDLLFVSNFKAGSAAVNECPAELTKKLQYYATGLTRIQRLLRGKNRLSDLPKSTLDALIIACVKFVELTLAGKSHIDGFGPSYASALLHFHFPNVVPILDRRVLSGARITRQAATQNNGQVKKEAFPLLFPPLIKHFYAQMKCHGQMTIADIDRDLFVRPLRAPYKKQKQV